MKLVALITLLFSVSTLANEQVCLKSYQVKKSDSIYGLYSNFEYKSHFKYKAFVERVKKENGMTKGSDIRRMTNKLISLPYFCKLKSVKKFVKRNSIQKTKPKKIKKLSYKKIVNKEKFDLYGLDATNGYSVTKISKAKKNNTIKKSDYKLKTKTSSSNVNNGRRSYNIIKPINLTIHKDFKLFEQNKIRTQATAANAIFINGKQSNKSTNEFNIATSLINFRNNLEFHSGVAFDNFSLVNNSEIQNLSYLDLKLGVIYKFNHDYTNYSVGLELTNSMLNLNQVNDSSEKEQINLFGSWEFSRGYALSSNLRNSIIGKSIINELGLALTFDI
jgi:hypothetical protein